MRSITNIAAGISLTIILGMATARAEILGFATNADGFDGFSNAETQIPLTAAGKTTLAFKTTQPNTTVMVTYNAECAVLGPPSKRLSIRITIDGANTHPVAGTNFALCAATNNTHKIYTTVSRHALIKVPNAGTHIVRVFGILPDGATFASVDDTTIVVQD